MGGTSRLWVVLAVVAAGCPEVNPDFVEGHGSTASSGGSGAATGTGSTGTTTTAGTAADGGASGGPGDGSGTGDPTSGTLGFACRDDADCDQDAGEECCTAAQCAGTCMIPCDGGADCPSPNMGCEHGYCLFRCDNNDQDCASWPMYTCQHMGQFCELD